MSLRLYDVSQNAPWNVYIDSILIDFNLKIEHHHCELENKVYYSN